jgi:hypothetical protein
MFAVPVTGCNGHTLYRRRNGSGPRSKRSGSGFRSFYARRTVARPFELYESNYNFAEEADFAETAKSIFWFLHLTFPAVLCSRREIVVPKS